MTIPIVNDQDEVVGHKQREQIDPQNDIFRTASLWITNPQGDVLLAQRKLDKKVEPGRWGEAVGGTVENDDSYEETVIREAQEELGLTNFNLQPGPKQLVTEPYKYFVQWFTTVVNLDISEFKIQTEEVEQIAWIPKAQLLSELNSNPDKYIAPMADIVDALY